MFENDKVQLVVPNHAKKAKDVERLHKGFENVKYALLKCLPIRVVKNGLSQCNSFCCYFQQTWLFPFLPQNNRCHLIFLNKIHSQKDARGPNTIKNLYYITIQFVIMCNYLSFATMFYYFYKYSSYFKFVIIFVTMI